MGLGVECLHGETVAQGGNRRKGPTGPTIELVTYGGNAIRELFSQVLLGRCIRGRV